MIKKLGLSLVSIIAILFVGTIFANPIPIDVKDFPYVCYKIENVEIDNYKVIIEYGVYNRNSLQSALDQREREVYEATKNECIKCSDGRSSKVYLLDKNTDITEITHENLEDKAIFIGEIYDSDCTSHYDIIKIYKINNNLGSYEIVQSNIKNLGKIRKFCLFWLFAVIIETLVLFIIAKIFRKENQISNKRLILVGILTSTITLPLLRFVLPLFITNEIIYMTVGELAVTLIETFIIKYSLKIERKMAILASVICNLCSFLIGLFIF